MRKVTPYKEINSILGLFTSGVARILSDNLVGVYLTGSLTYKDFNFGRSDIDLVVVLRKPVVEKEWMKLKKLHQQIEDQNPDWKKRIECSYVHIDMLTSTLPPKTPRPYYGEGVFYPRAPYGNEWLINNYYLYKCSISLVGPDYKELVKPINIKDVQQACKRDLFVEWEPKMADPKYLDNSHYQSYVVLNICRILYTINCGELASKKVTATWAKKEFPQWRDLIRQAENWQYGRKMNLRKETIRLIRFAINTAKIRTASFGASNIADKHKHK